MDRYRPVNGDDPYPFVVCKTCGSAVIDRSIHDAWHKSTDNKDT